MTTYFQDKIVWITGASSGIGEALAYEFAKEGAILVLSARRESELERVKTNCAGAKKVIIVPLDLVETDKMQEVASKVIGELGKVDILVNNGGISQRSLAKDTVLQVDRDIFEVNYFGTIALTKAVLPSMLEKKSGQIVVISSIVGKVGVPLRTAYSASKHALHGFFDALRAENWRENLKVLLVCPGFIKTNITYNALKGDGSKYNIMDNATNQGITAEKCAKGILGAIKRGKEEYVIGGFREKLAIFLKRFFPKAFSNMIKKIKTT